MTAPQILALQIADSDMVTIDSIMPIGT